MIKSPGFSEVLCCPRHLVSAMSQPHEEAHNGYQAILHSKGHPGVSKGTEGKWNANVYLGEIIETKMLKNSQNKCNFL